MAELGFFGDMVTILVTMPLTWGQRFRIEVRDNEGFKYLTPGFSSFFFLNEDCFRVANYRRGGLVACTYYITKACHDIPSQYIKSGVPKKSRSSLVERSRGSVLSSEFEKPNREFIHDLKKNVGPSR